MAEPSRARRAALPFGAISFVAGALLLTADAWFWHRDTAVAKSVQHWLAGAQVEPVIRFAGLSLLVTSVCFLWSGPKSAPPVSPAPPSPLNARRTKSWLPPLLIAAVIFLRYSATLTDGFFRYDDFQLLSVARDSPMSEALWLPHGDHFLPLTRLAYYAAFHLWGVRAFPCNLAVLLCFSAMLACGWRLLAELGTSVAARLVFVGLVAGWSPWGEVLSGYYVLSSYIVIAAAGLAAACLYLRWRRTPSPAALAGFIACTGLAPLVDLSGWYVAGTGLVFLLADFAARGPAGTARGWLRTHRVILGWFALTTGFALALTVCDYAFVHPGVFLDMAGPVRRSSVQLLGDLGYLFGAGVLVSMVVPLVYAALPATIFGGLVAVAFAAFAGFLIGVFFTAGRPRRRTVIALLGVVFGTGLMVVLGRPTAEDVAVRWAAKHVGPVYLWTCVLLGFGWDVLWRQAAGRLRVLMAEATFAGLILFLAGQTAFERIGFTADFPPLGYAAEIRDARRRRVELTRIKERLVAKLARSAAAPVVIPTLDGASIVARDISLGRYNLSHYLAFFGGLPAGIDLVRNSAMQPWHTAAVRTVPSLRSAVSPAVRRELVRDPDLRFYYFAPTQLDGRFVPDRAAPAAGLAPTAAAGGRTQKGPGDGFTVVSEGRTEISVRPTSWDPESQPHLLIEAQRVEPDSERGFPVVVTFWSEALQHDWSGSFYIPPSGHRIFDVDLLQTCAFALSDRVARLRIGLVAPGRYRFHRLEISR